MIPNATAEPFADKLTTSLPLSWPVRSAEIRATPPQTADTNPVTAVADKLEIDHYRSVQLDRLGSPVMFGDAHVPLNSDEAEPLEELDEVEADDEPELAAADEAVTADGAVGMSRLAVFWKPQPIAAVEASRMMARELFFISVLTLPYEHARFS